MLITLPAANIQEKMGKVCGHRFTPASREELRKLQQLAPRLKELGVARIVCSDLDGQSGAALARRLNVPVEEWQCLRRWNWGKLHGIPRIRATATRDCLVNDDVPIKGGDSKASFWKRIKTTHQRLVQLQQKVLVIADAEVLAELTGAAPPERYHLYEGNVCHQKPSGTMASAAAGSVNN